MPPDRRNRRQLTTSSETRSKASGSSKRSGSPNSHESSRNGENCENATANDDPEVQAVAQSMLRIREILGWKYVDVVDRLKLSWIPFCVYNQAYCKSHHHRKCPRPKVVDRQLSATVGDLSKQNRVIHYLKSIESLCIRMVFPGEEMVKRLLEMILTYKQPDDSLYTTEYIIQYCTIVAEMILMKFPPCWPDIKKSYDKLLFGKIDLNKVYSLDVGTGNKNIFIVFLTTLAETMKSSDDPHKPGTNSKRIESESESEMYDYTGWLLNQAKEADFSQHTREEKLDRLFVVLQFLTKILEYDLSIWLLRYLNKPDQEMHSENAPLLATVFFDGTYRQITPAVIQVFDLFVTSVCLQFPSDKVDILSRIISLLAVAIVSCEKHSTIHIRYPNIGIKAKNFAKEIFKIVTDKFGGIIEHVIKVIKAIKVPFIRYLLIDQLLLKLDRATGDMCTKKVYQLFKKGRWKCTEGVRQIPDETSDGKYKTLSPQKRPKSNEIYMHEYLDLVLDGLRAYCDTYHVKEIIQKVFIQGENDVEMNLKVPDPSSADKVRQLNLDLIENDIRDLEAKLLKRNMRFSAGDNETVPYNGIYLDGDIMNSDYRENIKYLGCLLVHIKNLRKTDADTNFEAFKEWYTFLNSMLSR